LPGEVAVAQVEDVVVGWHEDCHLRDLIESERSSSVQFAQEV
jgi:hypothetical protein